jgi:hypothetical protein
VDGVVNLFESETWSKVDYDSLFELVRQENLLEIFVNSAARIMSNW